MIWHAIPYAAVFLGALAATLVLTPVVREINRRLGMIDQPDARRINSVPVPRGGGLAIVLGVALSYGVFLALTGRPGLPGQTTATFAKLSLLSVLVALLGLADDKLSLRPEVKLLGQVVIAFLAWLWVGLGFSDLWPAIPAWMDALLTVFWIVGAVNAFNLIDGLDGLASGIALIAIVGMAGGLFFTGSAGPAILYFSLAGAILGFLRYNYHPASVFLGDCGSMFLGFVLSALPLTSHMPNSFLVSVGVPLLSMGVPIFDTALAIIRRLVRCRIARGGEGRGSVMSADMDHLHHRILRQMGFNQRRAALALYGIAASGVTIGLVAATLRSRASGFWLAAIAFVSFVVFKDATVELFDAGQLLNRAAHAQSRETRRRVAVFSVPFFVFLDILLLSALYVACLLALGLPVDAHALRVCLPVRVLSLFAFLVFFNSYRTVWSRAVLSNFMRLLLACAFGAIAGAVFLFYWPSTSGLLRGSLTFMYALLSYVVLSFVRFFRSVVRDLFYALDCSRIRNRKDISRTLVYGAGLRYRAFRRELVRRAANSNRVVVGLLDDDVLLRGKYIGGVLVYGTINDAPAVINDLNVDAVVIAFDVSDRWLGVVKEILAPTGVRITRFALTETPV